MFSALAILAYRSVAVYACVALGLASNLDAPGRQPGGAPARAVNVAAFPDAAADQIPVPQEAGVVELEQAPISAPLADEFGRAASVLYSSLNPGQNNALWWYTIGGNFQPAAYWALDDGVLGPGAVAAGGGHVTEYEFTFGVHFEYVGHTLRPYVIVNFYDAPPNPVGDASNPVVNPPEPVSSVGWLFDPLTGPFSHNFRYLRSGMLDLTALGYDFDLNETFYIEIIPLEWSSAPEGEPTVNPNVFAIFGGQGNLTVGENQNAMWSDYWVRTATCSILTSNGDGFYNHPAELDLCTSVPFKQNMSAFKLRGYECLGANRLELRATEPYSTCVPPGESLSFTLSQECLITLVRGYQAFLEFTPGALEFVDGSYMLPIPYGLPILSPISTVDDGIDLAAGIDNFGGQAPTDQPADLAVLTFMTGTTEGLSQVRFRLNEPPTQFSNALGQSLLPQLVDGPVLCVDGTPPALTCPPDLDLPSPDDLPPPALSYDEFVAQGGVAMDDNCFGPTPAVVTLLSESDNGGTGCPDNPHVITRVYRATDCALNFVDCTQMITVRDGAAPIFADVPADRQLAADAGTCAAVLTPELTPPTAIDNCTEAPPVLWTRSDGKPALTDPYDAADSPVTITWSSTDALGNEAIATTVITVAALNELVVTVELQPEFAAGPVTRCITFELWDCPATEPLATVQETVTFTAGLASAALLDVPCGTYSCITARDTLHALRRTQPLAVAGTQFVTSFTGDPNEGGDRLTGGNYNGDNWVDLLDFGVYSTQYATNPLAGANSGCATPAPHADANGDGIVNTADFTYIQINYLKSDEANCCGQPGLTGPGDPSTRIATSDLQALGLDELAHADVNADGWLDAQELVAFKAVTGTPARGVPAARGELPESEANPGRSE